MGTRADFYVGRGASAEWIGSIGYDGYPEGIEGDLFNVSTEEEFRTSINDFLRSRDDATFTDDGWPWPWDTSAKTDFAYAFDGGMVWAACFGYKWFDPKVYLAPPDFEDDEEEAAWRDELTGTGAKQCEWPDMSAKKRMAEPGTQRSGIMVFRL